MSIQPDILNTIIIKECRTGSVAVKKTWFYCQTSSSALLKKTSIYVAAASIFRTYDTIWQLCCQIFCSSSQGTLKKMDTKKDYRKPYFGK